ncbi:ATP synthase F1 subunit delta [Flectobacillus longus]|uniref:ATP synthase F1 subunit delta n=1 Tax=Flectobacillus longus TaxID=2984207 RepID=UPI0024B685F5|nr:ATP synthase F1 subunit delta [Flectobacillus longus]MDI9880359.1 ATP synthase F1 subunit delta [Flectobacillus longus]
MSEQSVAFRYAKSLIGLAAEKGVVEKVHEDMKFFDQVCDENRQLVLALKSPIVKHLQKLSILTAIFKDKVDPVTFSIFEIITKKNREKILPAIAEEFQRQYALYKGIQKAEITTVSPLTDAQKAEFIRLVTEATGKTVELVEKVNPELIGGYVLRINDRQIDTSVKARLNDLKVSFLQ